MNQPTRAEQIAFMKANYPQMTNKDVIAELSMNKSYFYRMVGRITKLVGC